MNAAGTRAKPMRANRLLEAMSVPLCGRITKVATPIVSRQSPYRDGKRHRRHFPLRAILARGPRFGGVMRTMSRVRRRSLLGALCAGVGATLLRRHTHGQARA